MNEITTIQQGDWCTTRDFAEMLGITSKSLVKWIQRHPEFIEKHCHPIGNGVQRKRYMIHKDGIVYYVNVRNSFNGNQFKSPQRNYLPQKELSADLANQKISEKINPHPVNNSTELSQLVEISRNLAAAYSGQNRELLSIKESQEEIKKRQQEIDQKLQEQEKEMNKPLPVSSIQRDFLRSRVKLFAIKQEIHFPIVWNKINEYVGRGGVAFYDFADFQKALKYLKKIYEEAGMDWE